MINLLSQKKIIDELSGLDLATYPTERAKSLIDKLKFPYIKITLYNGDMIMRARPNNIGERFNKKLDLSYKPKHLNEGYQRASTPNMTMFYGSFNPEGLPELDRFIGGMESLVMLRDQKSKGFQRITFGKWNVIKDINLIAVVQHDVYHKVNSFARKLNEVYNNFIKTSGENVEDVVCVSDFFAREFAKTEIKSDHDYLLSALFSEKVLSMGMDGVLYPCTRTEGKGFNVAIRPESADRCLDLEVVGECQIYKIPGRAIIDNGDQVTLQPHQATFELKESMYQYGEKNCLKRLGILSIDDLNVTI